MDAGQVAATGSVQELRSRWGSGYGLAISFKESDRARALAFVASVLPPSVPQDEDEKHHEHGQATFACGHGASTHYMS